MRGPDHALFEAVADFPDERIEAHINEKEANALHETIALFSEAIESQTRGVHNNSGQQDSVPRFPQREVVQYTPTRNRHPIVLATTRPRFIS